MVDEQQENNARIFQIKVQGYLDTQWSDWLSGMTRNQEGDGSTALYGSFPDQTVLLSVPGSMRDMNLLLISVIHIVPDGQTSKAEAKGVSQDE